jgi:GT2 family glycosyltransferase
MSNGTLVAVVVTYNRLAQLQVTVERLLAMSGAHLHALIVVDNASSDGTRAWLGTLADERLHALRLEENIGGAGGFATGMAEARRVYDPDWVVVMDDDGRPEPGAFEAFHASDLRGIDGVAAAVYFPDGRICEMNRPSRNPFWHPREFFGALFNGRSGFHIEPARYGASDPTQIDVTSFVGFFISRSGMDRVGLPDPRLFLYGDDGIYTLGLTRAGGKIAFLPAVRFEHDCQTFGSQQRGRFRPLWKVYYYHRNLLILYRMAAGPWMFWPVLILILPKWFSKIRHHPPEERTIVRRLMQKAIVDGLRHRLDHNHLTVLGWAEAPR